ncbi:MAG: hypothetical protein K9M02_21450 [Thiohalocapsa sp.]|nr:hypothetical protein [Thiohalocapsa sp.]
MIAQAQVLAAPQDASEAPPRRRRQVQQFSLLKSFSVRALISIVLVWGATSLLVSRFVEYHLVARDALVLQQLVLEIARQHDPEGYFSGESSADTDALNAFFGELVHLPDVGRITAYAANGEPVHSTDSGVGPLAPASGQALALALTGRQAHEKGGLDDLDNAPLLEQTEGVDWLVRHYIPISDADTGQVFGVIELYRIPIALERSIREGRRLIWLCELGGGVFLYLMLFWIVRRAHRLIQQQQKSLLRQARLATIGEMASSVAHGIRNPVASIRSSAELALEEAPAKEVRDSLEDIVAEVERFDGWVRELLTFAGDSDDSDDSGSMSDPAQCIDAAAAAMDRRARNQSVHIMLRVASDLPRVRGDAPLLTQVLNSLLANALDAMPDGGELIVEAARRDTSVRLTVTDTGFGIPADKLEGLFEPLTTYKRGGIGIGLALARQVVERQGGRILLHSAPGVGTNVVLDLAIADLHGSSRMP